jgi:glutathione S-transferase kappa 1
MRAMSYIKSSYSSQKYEDVFGELWIETWQRHNDLSSPEKMIGCLRRHFEAEDVEKIMAGASTPAIKQELLDVTKKALDRGAFGCPWFVVTNKEGKAEPFFGSDR